MKRMLRKGCSTLSNALSGMKVRSNAGSCCGIMGYSAPSTARSESASGVSLICTGATTSICPGLPVMFGRRVLLPLEPERQEDRMMESAIQLQKTILLILAM